MRKTKESGITLIALIITIIVMLILVGVTVTVALNGGLFTTAKDATKQTEEQAILEEMLSMMEITDDGKFNPEAIISKMQEKYNVEYSKPNATIKGKLGTYNYIVSETEIKIGTKKSDDVDDKLEKYILGANKTGRPLKDIFNNDNFTDDEITESVDETQTLRVEYLNTGHNEDNTKKYIYAKYDKKAYKIVCDGITSNTEKLELIYTPKGNEGKTTAEGWTILYDNGATVEAVSPTAMGELRLGYSEGTTDKEQRLTETIESYNNAITTINNYCKGLTGLPTNTGVRSVGGTTETSNMYTSSNLTRYNGVGKAGDILYENDYVRMSYWGVVNCDVDYWVASRCVVCYNSRYTYFKIYRGWNGMFNYVYDIWICR